MYRTSHLASGRELQAERKSIPQLSDETRSDLKKIVEDTVPEGTGDLRE
jgi:hypothetical protein